MAVAPAFYASSSHSYRLASQTLRTKNPSSCTAVVVKTYTPQNRRGTGLSTAPTLAHHFLTFSSSYTQISFHPNRDLRTSRRLGARTNAERSGASERSRKQGRVLGKWEARRAWHSRRTDTGPRYTGFRLTRSLSCRDGKRQSGTSTLKELIILRRRCSLYCRQVQRLEQLEENLNP